MFVKCRSGTAGEHAYGRADRGVGAARVRPTAELPRDKRTMRGAADSTCRPGCRPRQREDVLLVFEDSLRVHSRGFQNTFVSILWQFRDVLSFFLAVQLFGHDVKHVTNSLVVPTPRVPRMLRTFKLCP